VKGANGLIKATTTYTVHVVTGDIFNAGTDANVHIVLFGTSSDTGALKLTESQSFRNKFERGHIDVFKVEALEIGDIKKVRIGHDGTGPSSGWFLDRVEIEVASLGKR
jgi:hypothetical protein